MIGFGISSLSGGHTDMGMYRHLGFRDRCLEFEVWGGGGVWVATANPR